MVVGVVDETEGADRAGFETEVTHHPFGRGEREFAGGFETLRDKDILEPMLDVMDREIVVAREADEVVLVAFVVAHEDVFAMDGTIIVPPTFRLLDGLALGVIVGRERNVVFVQIAEDALLTVGNTLVVHITVDLIGLGSLGGCRCTPFRSHRCTKDRRYLPFYHLPFYHLFGHLAIVSEG